jgi:hypothetical protein
MFQLQVFSAAFFLLSVLHISQCAAPPKTPPENLIQDYTINQSIPLELYYVDDTFGGNGTHFRFLIKEIDSYIKGARKIVAKFEGFHGQFETEERISIETSSNLIKLLPKHQWIQYALFVNHELVRNKKICVFGSMEPWIEAFLLALDARSVLTIEYNQLTYEHPSIETISNQAFDQLYLSDMNLNSHYHSCDLAISASAFDHDGLGRYGDPLHPFADLFAMQKLKIILKEDGFLLLTVPIGPDVTVFNLHRRYGRIRLPMLLEGWNIISQLGWDETKLDLPADWRKTYEPIFILTPSNTIIADSEDTLSGNREEL